MIHARFDVDVIDHPRVIEAGPAAAGVWWFAVCWCRKHETDGKIPRRVLLGSFCGDKANTASVRALVKVGLLIDEGETLVVYNYAAKNETKDQISQRRSQTAKRVSDFRSRNGSGNAVTSPLVTANEQSVTNGSVPGSGSDSDQGSDPGGGPGEPPPDVAKIPAEQAYREAYQRGIAAAKGGPYLVPRNQVGELHEAILAFSEGRRGDRLLNWIQAAANDFATDLLAREPRDPKVVQIYSSFGPRGFARWLGEQERAREAKAVGS